MSDENATLLLQQKVRETISESDIPALAAVLVRVIVTPGSILQPAKETITSIFAQDGIRKVGAAGRANQIQPTDRFNLGSITKIFTATLVGHFVDLGSLRWDSRLLELMPELANLNGYQTGYDPITVQQLITHTAGMPYEPSKDNSQAYLNYTAADMTPSAVIAHRRAYTQAAVRDPMIYQLGMGCAYGGGGVICAHLIERIVGTTRYEDLVSFYVYNPLGMTHSGFGRMSQGPLDGPWQHSWNNDTLSIVPDQETMKPGVDWHPRAPVGGACCSAEDLGKFLTEQIRLTPKATTAATRKTMQTTLLTPTFTRGAWGAGVPPSAIKDIAYDGDNGLSYASVNVSLDRRVALGGMANVNALLAVPSIAKAKEAASFMDQNWATLFADPNDKPVECVHPRPALWAAGTKQFIAVRKYNGGVLLFESVNNGPWTASAALPAFTATSGLAGAASADGQRVFLVGRGTDRKMHIAISTNQGATWLPWATVGTGLFISGPSIAVSTDGNIVHLAGTGDDRKMYHTRLLHLGPSWDQWTPIGQGVFTASPGIACSQNGTALHLFGRGLDHRFWSNRSLDTGVTFAPHWQPIGAGVFLGSPSAACSLNGLTVHVAGRGTDRALWRNVSGDLGNTWLPHWGMVPDAWYNSSCSLVSSGDGKTLRTVGLGFDFHLYVNQSTDGGAHWGGASGVTNQAFI